MGFDTHVSNDVLDFIRISKSLFPDWLNAQTLFCY